MPKGQKKFELPALDIPSSSLTAGTSIPAPQPSPPLRKTSSRGWLDQASPQTPLQTDRPNPLRSHPTSSHSLSRKYTHDGQFELEQPPPANERREPGINRTAYHASSGSFGGVASPLNSPGASPLHPPKRTSTQGSSPPAAKRPLSVRRFLGLRSLSDALGRNGTDAQGRDSAAGMYSKGNRSSDKMSMFSSQQQERPGTAASNIHSPGLSKRRSSLMLFARRSSNLLGLSVDEDQNDSRDSEDTAVAQSPAGANGTHNSAAATPVDNKKKTPPPTLPGLDGLKASRGLRDKEGGYLGGGDMFRNIG